MKNRNIKNGATIPGCGSIILKHFGTPSFPLSLGRGVRGEAISPSPKGEGRGEAKKGGPLL